MWDLWPVIIVGIVVAYFALRYRETFVVKYGNPYDNEEILSFEPEAKGKRLFAITPDSCPSDKSDRDAGLCYTPCEEGYHGVGPVCWADSENVGIGTIPGIEWYKADVTSWGSIGCTGGRKFRFSGYDDCYSYTIWKARQVCYDDRENKDGLCYKKCPKHLPNRIPGMPYLCFKGTRGLSYGRGVGTVPPIFHFGE